MAHSVASHRGGKHTRPGISQAASITVLLACTTAAMPCAHASTALATLAAAPEWLALLHMRTTFTKGHKSEADSPEFFVSGRTDSPLAELEATLALFDKDPKAWCRFPARGRFLAAQHLISFRTASHCEALENWRRAFPREQITLVFPAVYLNSASSMFGHSFMRFDGGRDAPGQQLFARSVTYYADVSDDERTLSYIYRGLTGGFNGIVNSAPFFEELRKYNDNEDRDIFEYALTYQPSQIDYLVDHLWEVHGHSFDYYFFDENCSYRIIALLDVITPGHDMRNQFSAYTLPAETVNALKQRGLVISEKYRPSATKQLKWKLQSLSWPAQDRVYHLIHDENIDTTLKQASREEVLRTMEWLSLSIHKENSTETTAYRKRLKELTRHSLAKPDSREPAVELPPAQAPDTASPPSRLRASQFIQDQNHGTQLEWRQVLHALDDPLTGYDRGVALEALSATIRLDEQFANGRLQNLTLISANSLAPRDDFFTPHAWSFSLVRERQLIGEKEPLINSAEGLLGTSRQYQSWSFYAKLGGVVSTGRALNSDVALAAATRIGAVYQSELWSAQLEGSTRNYVAGENQAISTAGFTLARHLSRDISLNLSIAHSAGRNRSFATASYGFSWYF